MPSAARRGTSTDRGRPPGPSIPEPGRGPRESALWPARVLVFAGTRPECIKLAPLVRALGRRPGIRTLLVNSGQHRDAVRRTLAEFALRADVELPSVACTENLVSAHRHLYTAMTALARHHRPDLLIIQGDTLTAYSGAVAGRHAGCPVAHVEAGLRTDAIDEPFPEEWFRRRIARHARFHFTPCASATERLRAEGIDAAEIHTCGNTGIDALRECLHEIGDAPASSSPETLLVTLHRRSNYDRGAATICDALTDIAAARPELRIVFPVHPNPRMSVPIRRKLASHRSFALVEPMRYRTFVAIARSAALIISDSGGIQEEAPHLGTPLLVPRSNTERPESLATGFVHLVPVDRHAIVGTALDAMAAPRRRALPIDERAPYGAGDAAEHIARVLESMLMQRAAA